MGWLRRIVMIPALTLACGDGPAGTDADVQLEGDDAGECSDSADNDRDGAFDCDDADCTGSSDCSHEDDDSDGDGLLDLDEADLGTDPLLEDTDGDGYDDRDEVRGGTDPLDGASHPYEGGWPLNSEEAKQALEDATPAGRTAAEGERFKRFTLKDQFGEVVDLYDFSQQGVPIVIQVSAEWSGPCNSMSEWLSATDRDFWSDLGGSVQRAVAEGRLRWITVLGEKESGGFADVATARRWSNDYPNDEIPVLADAQGELVAYVDLPYWPTLYVLDQDMNLLAIDDHSLINGLVR